VTERVRTCLYLLNSDNVNSPTSPPTTLRVFACKECCLFLSSEMDEKLIELVRKCEELCDMSNRKYSDSDWKDKLWGQIGEELKRIRQVLMFFYCAFRSYYHSIIPEVLIINK